MIIFIFVFTPYVRKIKTTYREWAGKIENAVS